MSLLVADPNSIDTRRVVASTPTDGAARRPLAIDLYCGLGGWTEALLEEGWDVIGFDIERHDYGTGGYPGQLVLQDVRTLHGAQFRDADLIVASPPCQFFSRMAMPFKMPWKQAEYERRRNLAHELFWQCWRIQHEASEAAGREIPLIVENVRGAQKWIGAAAWKFGSFYLWGNIPALMPITFRGVMKLGVAHRANGETNFHGSAARANKSPVLVADAVTGSTEVQGGSGSANREFKSPDRGQDTPSRYGWLCINPACRHPWTSHDRQYGCSEDGCQCEQFRMNNPARGKERRDVHPERIRHRGYDQDGNLDCILGSVHDTSGGSAPSRVLRRSSNEGIKVPGISWSGSDKPGYVAKGFNTTADQRCRSGTKFGGEWWNDATNNLIRKASSKSPARKAASAQIAKIPYPLAQHIARVFKPEVPRANDQTHGAPTSTERSANQ